MQVESSVDARDVGTDRRKRHRECAGDLLVRSAGTEMAGHFAERWREQVEKGVRVREYELELEARCWKMCDVRESSGPTCQ